LTGISPRDNPKGSQAPLPGTDRSMSVSLVEEDSGDPQPVRVPSPERSASPARRFAALARSPLARSLLPRGFDALVMVAVTVFHHVLGIKYRFAEIAYDEHFFLLEGWSVVKGQVPYRDFQEFKPPVIIFVNALGIELFGLKDLGYRNLLSLLSLAGFLALTLALLSRRTERVLVVGTLLLLINHFFDDTLHKNGVINEAETLALDFFMLGTGVLLTQTKWERTKLVLGGVLLALSPLSKEPMAPAVVAAWLSLLLLHRIESGRSDAGRRFALFTLAGVGGVAATWLVYMLATRSLSWYVLQLQLNIAYSQNYAYQLGWAKRVPALQAAAEAVRRLTLGYVDAPHLATFVPFFVALLAFSGKRKIVVGIGALLTFVGALYAVTIGGGFSPNYFIMAMTGTFFCVVVGVTFFDEYAKRSWFALRVWLGASWLALALLLTSPRFTAEWKAYFSYKVEQPTPVRQSDLDFVRAHTSPGDKIWTLDNPLLYVYSDRVCAFRGGIVIDEIIDYYPGDTDEERLSFIREGLEENRPKLVLFDDTRVGPRRRRYAEALVFPFLRDGGYIRLNDRFYLRPD